MKYGLLINEEFTLAAPCGTVAPILCRVKGGGSIELVAKPKPGERLEGAALDIIGELARKLRRDDVPFHELGRNQRDGMPDRVDTICIWYGFVPYWLRPLLPASVNTYIDAKKRAE